VSVALKGIHALIECIGGLALVLVSTTAIQELVAWVTQDEIAEDPGDFIASHMLAWADVFCKHQELLCLLSAQPRHREVVSGRGTAA
jgi:uncharacterized membrane protein